MNSANATWAINTGVPLGQQSTGGKGSPEECMTIAETAAFLRCKPKTIRNKMSAGHFRENWHFVRPPRSRPLFIRSRIDPLAQPLPATPPLQAIPMARTNVAGPRRQKV